MIGITAAACPEPEVRNTLMMVFAISIAGACRSVGTLPSPPARACTTVSMILPSFMMALMDCARPMMIIADIIFLQPSRKFLQIVSVSKPEMMPTTMASQMNIAAISGISQSSLMLP